MFSLPQGWQTEKESPDEIILSGPDNDAIYIKQSNGLMSIIRLSDGIPVDSVSSTDSENLQLEIDRMLKTAAQYKLTPNLWVEDWLMNWLKTNKDLGFVQNSRTDIANLAKFHSEGDVISYYLQSLSDQDIKLVLDFALLGKTPSVEQQTKISAVTDEAKSVIFMLHDAGYDTSDFNTTKLLINMSTRQDIKNAFNTVTPEEWDALTGDVASVWEYAKYGPTIEQKKIPLPGEPGGPEPIVKPTKYLEERVEPPAMAPTLQQVIPPVEESLEIPALEPEPIEPPKKDLATTSMADLKQKMNSVVSELESILSKENPTPEDLTKAEALKKEHDALSGLIQVSRPTTQLEAYLPVVEGEPEKVEMFKAPSPGVVSPDDQQKLKLEWFDKEYGKLTKLYEQTKDPTVFDAISKLIEEYKKRTFDKRRWRFEKGGQDVKAWHQRENYRLNGPMDAGDLDIWKFSTPINIRLWDPKAQSYIDIKTGDFIKNRDLERSGREIKDKYGMVIGRQGEGILVEGTSTGRIYKWMGSEWLERSYAVTPREPLKACSIKMSQVTTVMDNTGKQVNVGDYVQPSTQGVGMGTNEGIVQEIKPDGSIVYTDPTGQLTMKQPNDTQFQVVKQEQNTTLPIQTTGV